MSKIENGLFSCSFSELSNYSFFAWVVGTSGFVAFLPIGGKRREEPRSQAIHFLNQNINKNKTCNVKILKL